jgi:hypothetical protein
VTRDRLLDRRAGPLAQPRFEDRSVRPTLANRTPDEQAVPEIVAEPLDRGPSRSEGRRADGHPMKLPEVPDLAAIARPAACCELRPDPGVSIEMAPDPTLAFAEKLHGPALPVDSPGSIGRHGHDHAALGMDDDPERAGSWGVAEREGYGAAGQVRHGRRLDRSSRGQKVVALRSVTRR